MAGESRPGSGRPAKQTGPGGEGEEDVRVGRSSEGARRDGRPPWDEYYMRIAVDVARRSTCLRHHVGSIIVKDNQVLASGYNGSPRGLPHCEETGCLRERLGIPSGEQTELCNAVHAEQNAIVQAAVHGVSIAGGTLYTTHQPCIHCSKMLINARVFRVVYGRDYREVRGLEMLRAVGVEVVRFRAWEVPDRREPWHCLTRGRRGYRPSPSRP